MARSATTTNRAKTQANTRKPPSRRTGSSMFAIDDRTTRMSEDVLACRSDSHWWRTTPSGAKQRERNADLLADGLRERFSNCARCTAERRQLVDVETYEVVSSTIKYPDGYLLTEKGGGRLPRREARRAFDHG